MISDEKPWLVYVLQCGDGSYYTGITNDISKRLLAHESGRGAKYTRGRAPLRLVFEKPFKSKGEALREERAIKRLNRQEKLVYIGKT